MNTSVAAALRCFLLFLVPIVGYAGSAQWNLNPTSGAWNTAGNWTPMTVPNGPADIATFALSNITGVLISEDTEVNGITFTSAATNPYSIAVSPGHTLTLSGTGITNNSGIAQVLNCDSPRYDGGQIFFSNSASAGNADINSYGLLQFSNNSTAGSSSILNAGDIDFFNTSTAGDSHIINLSTTGITFWDSSSAGGATISVYDVSYLQFLDNSTAGNATISSLGDVVFSDSSNAGSAFISSGAVTAYPGFIYFYGSSQGGTAQIELLLNPYWNTFGVLDISDHDAPGVTIGSIEGDEHTLVFLGANNLTVGSNNLSTTFSGVIEDSGELTKLGTGTFTLSGANIYTGGTTVSDGVLVISNRSGSGTGSGAVQVNAGTIGGRGIIAGAVTVGTGSGAGAFLSPSEGALKQLILTIHRALTFKSDATYTCRLSTRKRKADMIIAHGVTIDAGATFAFVVIGNRALTAGTVFTAISNTSANPISGTFSNLPDGSVFSANGNNFQVSYEGGDGNDLTLTVVP